MKPSPPPTDHLTEQQLAGLVGGTLDAEARGKAEKLLQECELSREAAAGFTALPEALGDVAGLQKQIARRSGMHAPRVWTNVLAGVAAAAVIAAAIFFAWPGNAGKPVAQQPSSPGPAPEVLHATLPPVTILSPKTEHFVNPEAKPVVRKPVAGPRDSSAAPVKEAIVEAEASEAPPADLQPVVVPSHPEPGYNAPVGFVLDLKVTEYDKLYKGTITIPDVRLPGVPAEFEDEKSRDRAANEREPVREVRADQPLVDGLQAFRDERYERCIEKMAQLRKRNPGDLNAAFYTAVSYVKLGMYGNAIPLLDQVLNAANNVFHEEARWYKALALLGNGDTEAARKLLTEIASGDGFYRQQAREKVAALK